MTYYKFRCTVPHATGTRNMVWWQDPEPRRCGWRHAEHNPGTWLTLAQATAVMLHLIQVGHVSPITVETKRE